MKKRNGFDQTFSSNKPKLTKWYKRGCGTITVTEDGVVAHREHPDRVEAVYRAFGTWNEAVLYLEGKS